MSFRCSNLNQWPVHNTHNQEEPSNAQKNQTAYLHLHPSHPPPATHPPLRSAAQRTYQRITFVLLVVYSERNCPAREDVHNNDLNSNQTVLWPTRRFLSGLKVHVGLSSDSGMTSCAQHIDHLSIESPSSLITQALKISGKQRYQGSVTRYNVQYITCSVCQYISPCTYQLAVLWGFLLQDHHRAVAHHPLNTQRTSRLFLRLSPLGHLVSSQPVAAASSGTPAPGSCAASPPRSPPQPTSWPRTWLSLLRSPLHPTAGSERSRWGCPGPTWWTFACLWENQDSNTTSKVLLGKRYHVVYTL